MHPASLDDPIHQLARSQGGHVARWQLIHLGLSPSQADRVLVRPGWTTFLPGVARLPDHHADEVASMWAAILAAASYLHRGSPGTGPPKTWWIVHSMARRAYGVTGFTAAWLLDLVDVAPTRPQILLPHDARCRVSGVRVIRTRAPIGQLEGDAGPPRVHIHRLIWDCAQLVGDEETGMARVRRLMTRADGLRLLRAKDMYAVARSPRTFGLPSRVPEPFRAAAFSLAGGHSHSKAEHLGRQIVTEVAASFGLVAEPRPLAIPDEEHAVAEADIAIARLRLDIEIDGPHHDEPDQQRKDRWRDHQLWIIGWTVRRYPWTMVYEDPERFRQLVTADILRTAAALGITLTQAA